MTPSPTTLYAENTDTQSQLFKICKTCYRELPTTQFEKANYGRTLRGDCKECQHAKKKTRATDKQFVMPTITSKICVRCGFEKPVSEFTRVSINTDGLHSYCKECKTAGERARTTKKAEEKRQALKVEYENMEPALRPTPKVCGNTGCHLADKIQPPENFDRSKIHSTGLRIDCRLCEIERKRSNPAEASKDYHSRWYQDHKEELNKRTKEWRDTNPEECRKLHIQRRFRQYGITQEWYNKTLIEQGGRCAICGSTDPKSNGNTFHVDHYHGCCSKGCHACDKCRRGLLCGICNTRLGVLEHLEWVKQAIAYLRKYPLKDAEGNNQPSLFDNLK